MESQVLSWDSVHKYGQKTVFIYIYERYIEGGYEMMNKNICLACWGTGLVPDFWDETKEVQCPRCHGTGKEPNKTNFQCITASPQALAEFIWIITDICLNYDKYSVSEIKKYEKCLQDRNDIVEWLEKENTDNILPLPQEK